MNERLALSWDHGKNFPLTPDLFTEGSKEKIWWLCGSGHSWKASIASRVHGTGCPYCSSRKVNHENSLATKFPEIATQWNYLKNGDVTPESIVGGTHRRYWWLCEKGHEWEAQVSSRTGNKRGCPYCSGNKLSPENSFASLYPAIAKEWNHERNDKKPSEVMKKSDYMAWWECSVCGHEWQAKVYARAHGRGCIKCSYTSGIRRPKNK